MVPDMLRKIYSALKSNQGCSLDDLVDNLPGIYRSADIDPGFVVLDSAKKLVEWGLAEAFLNSKLLSNQDFENYGRWDFPKKIKFYLSRQAIELEETFGVALDNAKEPLFGKPKTGYPYPEVLVLMPFLDELRPVYTDHIQPIAAKLGLKVGRADDFFTTGFIMEEVWSAIYEAKIVIADCTGRNPNVFYEIGIAHTIGKSTILISQAIEDIPFDLRHMRVMDYENSPAGLHKLEQSLENTISHLLDSRSG